MKIEIIHLKTGNILNYDSGEGIYPTAIDWQDLKWLHENPNEFNQVHNPITLTIPELNRLGFSEDDYKTGYIGIDIGNTDFVLTIRKENNNEVFYFECEYGGFKRSKKINYIHELQNFFYEIHESELNYTYPKYSN